MLLIAPRLERPTPLPLRRPLATRPRTHAPRCQQLHRPSQLHCAALQLDATAQEQLTLLLDQILGAGDERLRVRLCLATGPADRCAPPVEAPVGIRRGHQLAVDPPRIRHVPAHVRPLGRHEWCSAPPVAASAAVPLR